MSTSEPSPADAPAPDTSTAPQPRDDAATLDPHAARSQSTRWFLYASLALSIAVAWRLLPALGAGAVLAFASERPIEWLLRKLRREHSAGARWVASGVVIALVLVVFLLPLLLASAFAAREATRFLTAFRWEAFGNDAWAYLDGARRQLDARGVHLGPDEVAQRLRGVMNQSTAWAARALGSMLSATPQLLFGAGLTLLTWVTLAATGRAARDRVLPVLLPWDAERAIIRRVTADVIDGVLVANVMVSLVQAVVCTVVMLALRIPNALVWGVLTFFVSFVPAVGTMVVTLGAAAYCFTHGRPIATGVMLVAAVVVGSIDNVLRPAFMRSSVNLSFLWILVALVGGVTLFGLSGVVLGPLAFSLLAAFFQAHAEARGA